MRSKEKTQKFIRGTFRIADTMLFSFLLMLPILPYIKVSVHRWIAIPVYLLIAAIVFLLRWRCRSISRKKQSFQIEEQQQIEHILLLSDEALSDRFGKEHFILVRKEHPDRFDIMEAIRKHADAIGLFSEDAALHDLILSYSPQTAIYLRKDLLRAYNPNIGKDNTIKGRAFDKILLKHNRYFILGILFLAASFFLRSKIYYRMIATVCLIIASVSGILGHRKSCKNFLIFLDKMDD